jgi:hypothetical protein
MYLVPKLYESLYLRFKDLPPHERSGIYDCEGNKIGEELGVSCYRGVVINDKVYIIMPHKASSTYYFLIDQYNNHKIPLYVIKGIEIGCGTDGEPLLKNVIIDRKIKDWIY